MDYPTKDDPPNGFELFCTILAFAFLVLPFFALVASGSVLIIYVVLRFAARLVGLA